MLLTRILCHATVIAALLGIISPAGAGISLDPRMESVVDDLLAQRYRKAGRRVEAVLAAEPLNIDALFMKINILQIEIVDYESYVINGYAVIASIDSVLALFSAVARPANARENARLVFYKGTLSGMKALVLGKVGEWMPALRYARDYLSAMKEAASLDTALYETAYGTGLYHYYVGYSLKWIPFMGGKSRKGIREIERVATSASPLRYMAVNSLSWIYIERGEYDKAVALVSPVLANYPDNTIYLGIKARALLSDRRYAQARPLGVRLVELSRARSPVNWVDLLGGYQVVAACLDAEEKYAECLRVIDEALALKVPQQAKKIEYVQKHLDYLAMKKNEIRTKH